MNLGLHYSLDEASAYAALSVAGDDRALIDLSSGWDASSIRPKRETDNSWDFFVYQFTSKPCTAPPGTELIRPFVLGARSLDSSRGTCLVRHLSPAEVSRAALEIDALSKDRFVDVWREMYRKVGESALVWSDDSLRAWESLLTLREFFAQALHSGRHVVFVVTL